MNLTSVNRMIRYLASQGGANLTNNTYNRRDILQWLATVSKAIEKSLGRLLKKEYRTEYIDINDKNQQEFFVKAYPIRSISSVYIDSLGLFDGAESALVKDEYIISSAKDSIFLLNKEGYVSPKAIELSYTGGLCTSGVISTYTLSSISGTITEDLYCIGQDSYAVGIVDNISDTSLQVEVLYGVFEQGEVLNFNVNEDGSDTNNILATLQTKDEEAICEAYPEITTAAEIEVRYRWKHKFDFENSSTNKDGTSQRAERTTHGLRPETLATLNPYKNYYVY